MKLEIEVPDEKFESWFAWLVRDGGAFERSSSGYWLYGAHRILDGSDVSWLVYEQVDDARPVNHSVQAALSFAKRGHRLPPRFFILDRAVALRAFAEGVRRAGQDFWVDGPSADGPLQHALLGEDRYG